MEDSSSGGTLRGGDVLDAVLKGDHGIEGVVHPLAELQVVRSAPLHSPALKGLGTHAPTRGQIGLAQDLPWGHMWLWGHDAQRVER